MKDGDHNDFVGELIELLEREFGETGELPLAKLASRELSQEAFLYTAVRDLAIRRIQQEVPGVRPHGHGHFSVGERRFVADLGSGQVDVTKLVFSVQADRSDEDAADTGGPAEAARVEARLPSGLPNRHIEVVVDSRLSGVAEDLLGFLCTLLDRGFFWINQFVVSVVQEHTGAGVHRLYRVVRAAVGPALAKDVWLYAISDVECVYLFDQMAQESVVEMSKGMGADFRISSTHILAQLAGTIARPKDTVDYTVVHPSKRPHFYRPMSECPNDSSTITIPQYVMMAGEPMVVQPLVTLGDFELDRAGERFWLSGVYRADRFEECAPALERVRTRLAQIVQNSPPLMRLSRAGTDPSGSVKQNDLQPYLDAVGMLATELRESIQSLSPRAPRNPNRNPRVLEIKRRMLGEYLSRGDFSSVELASLLKISKTWTLNQPEWREHIKRKGGRGPARTGIGFDIAVEKASQAAHEEQSPPDGIADRVTEILEQVTDADGEDISTVLGRRQFGADQDPNEWLRLERDALSFLFMRCELPAEIESAVDARLRQIDQIRDVYRRSSTP